MSLMTYTRQKQQKYSDYYKCDVKSIAQYRLQLLYIYYILHVVKYNHMTPDKRRAEMRTKKEKLDLDRFGLLVDTPRLMELCSSGRQNAIGIGTAAQARVQIGRSVLWNVKKIQQYIDLISE